jgi:hypothetical protein
MQQSGLKAKRWSTGSMLDRHEERENPYFIMDNQGQTLLLIEQQDEHLDKLGKVVNRGMANTSSVV